MTKKRVKAIKKGTKVERKPSVAELVIVGVLTFVITFGSVVLGKFLGRTEAALNSSQQIVLANYNVKQALNSGMAFGRKLGYKFGYHDAAIQARKALKAKHK